MSNNLFERSILLSIGLAAVAKELVDSMTEEMVKRGEATAEEGRKAFDEAVDKTREEARTMRGRFDATIQRGYRDMGVATSEQMDEIQLKLAQLEHRLSLVEAELASRREAGDEDMASDRDKTASR